MSSNGVILQHRAELIAYLFVDRSDNLLIGNHIKKSLPDDRRLQLGKYRKSAYVRRGRLQLPPDFFTLPYPSLQPACPWPQYIAKTYLRVIIGTGRRKISS